MRCTWRKDWIYMKKTSWDLYGENMRYTFREHKLYVNRAWDVKKSIREYKISIKISIWIKHKVLIKRSWDLLEDSMDLHDDSLGLYIKRS